MSDSSDMSSTSGKTVHASDEQVDMGEEERVEMGVPSVSYSAEEAVATLEKVNERAKKAKNAQSTGKIGKSAGKKFASYGGIPTKPITGFEASVSDETPFSSFLNSPPGSGGLGSRGRDDTDMKERFVIQNLYEEFKKYQSSSSAKLDAIISALESIARSHEVLASKMSALEAQGEKKKTAQLTPKELHQAQGAPQVDDKYKLLLPQKDEKKEEPATTTPPSDAPPDPPQPSSTIEAPSLKGKEKEGTKPIVHAKPKSASFYQHLYGDDEDVTEP